MGDEESRREDARIDAAIGKALQRGDMLECPCCGIITVPYFNSYDDEKRLPRCKACVKLVVLNVERADIGQRLLETYPLKSDYILNGQIDWETLAVDAIADVCHFVRQILWQGDRRWTYVRDVLDSAYHHFEAEMEEEL